jgi:hypothetical protein
MQGKFDLARDNFLQAQSIFHHSDNQLRESQTNVYIGILYSFKGHLHFLIAYLRRALDLVASDVCAQGKIQQMLEQAERGTDREMYRLAWKKSTQYYQSLC